MVPPHQTSPGPTVQSWHHLITIDLLARILNRSIFHPFIAWLIPFCLRAVALPPSDLKFRVACLWAILVSLAHIFQYISHRVAFGAPRTLNWSREVVVITGGASGLGRILASMYSLRGVSVAVLDIKGFSEDELQADESLANISFYQCDVGDEEQVRLVKKKIEKELGRVTILINNAAVLHGKTLLELNSAQIERSFRVNVLAHFNTIRTFLPAMLSSRACLRHGSSVGEKADPTSDEASEGHDYVDDEDKDEDEDDFGEGSSGGTIVTIASVLGKLGAAQLTDYAASKAALIALHRSLQAEVAQSASSHHSSPPSPPSSPLFSPSSRIAGSTGGKIAMLLVTPGQLGTHLFAGVRTPSNFFGPVVAPVELARAIVEAVDAGVSGEISLPLYARYVEWMYLLPVSIQRGLRWVSGVDVAMRDYRPPNSSPVPSS